MTSYAEKYYAHVGDPDRQTIVAIETKTRQAFAANNAFLAIATPTAAQVTAHTKLLTKEINGILRLILGDFSADDS